MAKRNPAPRARPAHGAAGTQIEIGAGGVVAILAVAGLLAAGAVWLVRGRAAPSGAPAGSPTAMAQAVPAGATAVPSGRTAEGDPFIGSASAPVTIVAYSDYQCPNCRQFALEVLPWLRQTWIARGTVRVVFRDFPVRGPESIDAALAAQCAGDQGRYWEMHDRLFEAQSGENTGAFGNERLRTLAAAASLDTGAFDACMSAATHRARIDASAAAARAQAFEGTPTYLINGRKTQGAIRIADWEQLFQLYQQDFARATQGTSR